MTFYIISKDIKESLIEIVNEHWEELDEAKEELNCLHEQEDNKEYKLFEVTINAKEIE